MVFSLFISRSKFLINNGDDDLTQSLPEKSRIWSKRVLNKDSNLNCVIQCVKMTPHFINDRNYLFVRRKCRLCLNFCYPIYILNGNLSFTTFKMKNKF